MEKVVRSVKNNCLETNIGATKVKVLRFADDLNLVGDSIEVVT